VGPDCFLRIAVFLELFITTAPAPQPAFQCMKHADPDHHKRTVDNIQTASLSESLLISYMKQKPDGAKAGESLTSGRGAGARWNELWC